jgi:4'-phosphopantetheinyl transferase
LATQVSVWFARRGGAGAGLDAYLDQDERARYEGYRREEDRQRFLVGCALAKAAVARATGADPAGVTFDRTCTRCGKPHGKPATHSAQLSVSHSGDMIAVAVTSVTPVGIDVEQVRAVYDTQALAGYVLSDSELSGREQGEGFFVTWARKEAVTKATGDGLRVPFREVIVSAPDEPPRLIAWPYPASPDTVTLLDLDASPGYAAALAVLGGPVTITTGDGTALVADLAR